VQRVSARILEPDVFYPIDAWQVWQFIRGRDMPADSYSIHLWHAKWHHWRLDADAVYSKGSIYEQLKRRYGVASPPGAARGPGWLQLGRHGWRQVRTRLYGRQPARKAA
jgi:hypothetical protein